LSTTLRIGTRGSKLALWQTQWVAACLGEINPSLTIAVEVIKTTGDQIQDIPLARIGDKGLFTKELDRALLEHRVDLVVHSLKDVPTAPVEGIVTAAIPAREDPRDAFFGKRVRRLKDLPPGALVATGSLRRRAQLLAMRPDLELADLRGNIDTRLRKLADTETLDGIILALAGVRRLGLTEKITEILSPETWIPAPAQGALAIQARTDDVPVRQTVSPIDHELTRTAVAAERAVLARFEGGCHVPMGAYARVEGGEIIVDAFISTERGSQFLRAQRRGPLADAEQLGFALADELLARGGAAILAELRKEARHDDEC
jgi:hydroxymethylbilane synthase